jgi:hypothetical protein
MNYYMSAGSRPDDLVEAAPSGELQISNASSSRDYRSRGENGLVR